MTLCYIHGINSLFSLPISATIINQWIIILQNVSVLMLKYGLLCTALGVCFTCLGGQHPKGTLHKPLLKKNVVETKNAAAGLKEVANHRIQTHVLQARTIA